MQLHCQQSWNLHNMRVNIKVSLLQHFNSPTLLNFMSTINFIQNNQVHVPRKEKNSIIMSSHNLLLLSPSGPFSTCSTNEWCFSPHESHCHLMKVSYHHTSVKDQKFVNFGAPVIRSYAATIFKYFELTCFPMLNGIYLYLIMCAIWRLIVRTNKTIQ